MRNKKYIEPNLVKIAAEQDVFDILVRDGVPMKRTSGVYRHRKHDSLVITKGEGFYWFSQGYGSKNPIDYYVKVENMPFVDAAYKVLEVMNFDYSRKDIVLADNSSVNPNYMVVLSFRKERILIKTFTLILQRHEGLTKAL